MRVADLGHRSRLPCVARSGRREAMDPRSARSRLAGAVQVLDLAGDWSRDGPACGRAVGHSNTPTRIIPISTTRRWWRWLSIVSSRWSALYRERSTGRRMADGLQSQNYGWAAFDADNTYYYLNDIPFADHGALLDPPTADVSARCLSFLARSAATDARRLARDRLSAPRTRKATARGSAAGARITFTAPGRR